MPTIPSRLGIIIQLIASNPGITLTKLCAALKDRGIGLTERTIAKDILLLKHEYGLLPAKERLRGGYFLNDIYTLSQPEVSLILDALHVFGVRLNDPEASRMRERLTDLAGQFQHLLPAGHTRTVRQSDIYKGGRSKAEVENVLLAAIRSQSAVSYMYRTPRLDAERKLKGYPLLMVFHERGWYCIVRDLDENKYFPRRLDRILACTNMPRRSANDQHAEDLRTAQLLISCGWGMTFPNSVAELESINSQPEIIVRFDRSLAPFMLESADRHPRGKIIPTRDGTGEAEFRIRLLNPTEFQYWVRSFGSKAWFVAPQNLVASERAELRRMTERYQN